MKKGDYTFPFFSTLPLRDSFVPRRGIDVPRMGIDVLRSKIQPHQVN